MGKNKVVEISEENIKLNKKEQKKYDKLRTQHTYHDARAAPLGKPRDPEEAAKVTPNLSGLRAAACFACAPRAPRLTALLSHPPIPPRESYRKILGADDLPTPQPLSSLAGAEDLGANEVDHG